MGKDFDCNINNSAINKTDTVKKEKSNLGKGVSCEQEYKEGSSLNLSPSTVAGRSMVDVKLPEKIMQRDEFEELAKQKITKNLSDTEPSDFVSKLIEKVKPEEQEDFLKWVDYCNGYAEIENQNCGKSKTNNDMQELVENFNSFVCQPALRANLDDCIELIEKYKNEDEDEVESKEDRIYILIQNYIKDKTPEQIKTHLKACDVMQENFMEKFLNWAAVEVKRKPELSYLQYIEPEIILKLAPLAKGIKLDIEAADVLSKSDKKEKLLSDAHIKKVFDAIPKIDENSPNIEYMRDIIKQMVLSDGEHIDICKKWLNFINDNFETKLHKITILRHILDVILFGRQGNISPSEKKRYNMLSMLVDNKEVLDAIRNVEIDISNGIKFSSIDKNSTEYETNKNYYKNIPPDFFIEHILMNNSRLNDEKQVLIDNTNSYVYSVEDCLLEILSTNSKEKIFDVLNKIEQMKSKSNQRPDLYLSGNKTSPRMVKAIFEDFYDNNSLQLFRLVSTLDKEAIDVLMRKRHKEFKEYLNYISTFSSMELYLLNKLSNSVNIDGKPFLPAQKAEFIDLIMGYKNNKLGKEKLFDMADDGKVDLAGLKLDLFNKIMKNTGLKDEEISQIPKEKLVAWDTRYAHLLAKGYLETDDYNEVDEKGYNDIIRAANLCDFDEYINDETNDYGRANANTKQIYDELNLNYDKWVHPSKDNEIDFVSRDKNQEQLKQIIAQITEDMNTLMGTPVKGHIKKHYPDFVIGDKFVIPKEYEMSKAKTLELVESFVNLSDSGKMAPVWNRAIKNLRENNPDKKETAQRTETIYQHLHQRINDLDNVSDVKIEKNLDWKIKMWDRYPQKDLFQGNYSTCCIGVGNGNGHAMPHYLMNTAFNMIEMVDNESGKTVGNALCYFVKTENGKPALVIDNVEINNSEKPSTETGKMLREKIFEYASSVAKDVTGREDTPVFMSNQYNDIPFTDLHSKNETITFLGDMDCENIYLDMFGEPVEWTSRNDLTQTCTVLSLK